MKTLKVTLKQHTPLIHFQHDQYGATLRASEVKPKLDRFIIKNVFHDEWEECKEYLIGYKKIRKEDVTEKEESKLNRELEKKFKEGFRALNYKLRIEAENSDCGNYKRIPMYFGNMGGSAKKEIRYSMRPITLSFVIDEKLEAKLKDVIADFFIVTNFGTRQSKGYGSFYIDKKDPLYKSPDDFLKSHTLSHIQTKVCTRECCWEKVQGIVDVFYKTLRSGINVCSKICSRETPKNGCRTLKKSNVNIIVDSKQSEKCKSCEHFIFNGSIFYFKSALFYYINNQLKEQWDKKTIKEALNNNYNGEKKLYRDLLGLASETKMWKYKIKKESKEIERYKSPIFIKPIQEDNDKYTFYVGFEKIDDNILGVGFDINKIEDNGSSTTLLELKTPNDFNLDDYFKYLFDVQPKCNFTIDDLVSNKHIRNKKTNEVVAPDSKKHEYYELLKDIYNQLRQNYKAKS